MPDPNLRLENLCQNSNQAGKQSSDFTEGQKLNHGKIRMQTEFQHQEQKLKRKQKQEQNLSQNQIEKFINTQVVNRGLDERTAKAYRLDLEQFYLWLGAQEESKDGKAGRNGFGESVPVDQGAIQQTFPKITQQMSQEMPQDALHQMVHEMTQEEDQSSISHTSSRISQQFLQLTSSEKCRYEEWMENYLRYLSEEKKLRFSTVSRKQRVFRYYLSYLAAQGIVKEYKPLKPVERPKERLTGEYLTKKEIDAFFQAIQQEYKELNSDFRRRVCLRDQVMMELLFYHKIEVSELLRLKVSDYNPRAAVLTVPRKKEKERKIYLFSKALQGQMARWLEEHEYFEHDGTYRDRMFLSKLGKPLSMKMVVNIFDKYRVRAGIEKVCTPKDLKGSLGRYAEEVVREMG